MENIEAKGVSYIGRCRSLSARSREIFDRVLLPANMTSNDLSNPTHGEVEILLGGDGASLQLFDHNQLNKLKKT